MKATTEDGSIFINLTDQALKTGAYSIKGECYFKGSQSLSGYPAGKPSMVNISVRVVE